MDLSAQRRLWPSRTKRVSSINAMLFALTVGLAGCNLVTNEDSIAVVETNPVEGPTAANIARDVDVFRSFIAGKTFRAFDPQHGNQVEFFARDGTVSLWYPGNSDLVPGRWIAEPLNINGPTQICFKYGLDSFNPVTERRRGNWECRDASAWLKDVKEIRNRDPLEISRALPFVLNAQPEQSTSDLARRAGLSPPQEANLANWSQTCCID